MGVGHRDDMAIEIDLGYIGKLEGGDDFEGHGVGKIALAGENLLDLFLGLGKRHLRLIGGLEVALLEDVLARLFKLLLHDSAITDLP